MLFKSLTGGFNREYLHLCFGKFRTFFLNFVVWFKKLEKWFPLALEKQQPVTTVTVSS